MDRICGVVLDKLHQLSPSGRYVIVEEDELYEAFPEDGEKNYGELERVLSVLKKDGYIDVKYSRGDMFCIAPLKEYKEETPIPSAPVQQPPQKRKIDFVFISAFIGGALGSLIVSLIFAVL